MYRNTKEIQKGIYTSFVQKQNMDPTIPKKTSDSGIFMPKHNYLEATVTFIARGKLGQEQKQAIA